MAVFLVVSESASPGLGRSIAEKYPDAHLPLSQCSWLVESDKLSVELSRELGLQGGALGRAILVPFESFAGWHKRTVWEWIKRRVDR